MSDQPVTLRVAIAGCHRMVTRTPGSHNWAAAFAAVPETKVVAVYDRSAETRAQFLACWQEVWGTLPAYDDYPRLLAETQPDIICIATRQTLHADQCEQAVAAGVRGVLMEKPLATSLAEVDRIVAACQKAGVSLAFGLDRRWVPAYRHLRQLVAEGVVGTVVGIIAYGVPNLINHGCHWYDVALAFAGDAEPVWASGQVVDLSAEPPGSPKHLDPPGRGWIGLANGVVLTVLPEGGPGVSFEVLGTAGRLLILDDARQAYVWRLPDRAGAGAAVLQRVEVPVSTELWPAGPALVRDLVQAVRGKASTACAVDHARRATEIGFAIHYSHTVGGARISLPCPERTLRIPSFAWGNE